MIVRWFTILAKDKRYAYYAWYNISQITTPIACLLSRLHGSRIFSAARCAYVFDLHTQKCILRDWSGVLSNDVPERVEVMATWVTHLMIADRVLEKISGLDRHGFCVGNIAPDCNVENEDWTSYTPSRAVTHWMSGERKAASDCERFYNAYIADRMSAIKTNEEYSFLIGYWSHLIADAEFQRFIRDENRVASVWGRIKAHPILSEQSFGMPENWDSVKILIKTQDRIKDIYSLEADYLDRHPESGYFTEILKLKSFPDYIDYLPKGAIVRKVNVMGDIPVREISTYPYVAISGDEYQYFVDRSVALTVESIESKGFFAF